MLFVFACRIVQAALVASIALVAQFVTTGLCGLFVPTVQIGLIGLCKWATQPAEPVPHPVDLVG